MSPYYLKEGESWRKWRGEPKDIGDKNGNRFSVTISSVVKDPEQIRVSVAGDESSYVLGERGSIIFPGESKILNGDGFEVINARTRQTLAKVKHREKPSKK